MGDNRYPKQCLEMLLTLADGREGAPKYNWVKKVKHFFSKIQELRTRQSIQLTKIISTQIYNMYRNHSIFREINSSFNSGVCPNYFRIRPNSILCEHLLNPDLKCTSLLRLSNKHNSTF